MGGTAGKGDGDYGLSFSRLIKGYPSMIKSGKNDNRLWYQVHTRKDQERVTFEADIWSLNGHSDVDFESGKIIETWLEQAWFAASKPDLEGPMEDVLKTANLLPVFSERLKSALENEGVTGIQYLPVTVYNSNRQHLSNYFLANILNLVPALNEEKSQLVRRSFKDKSGNVVQYVARITKTVFDLSKLTNFDIIRLSQTPDTIYVSERFKRVFEMREFRGIWFTPVDVE